MLGTATEQRFADLSPGDFRTEIDRYWNELSETVRPITDAVVQQVEAEKLSPQTGYGIIAATLAEVSGYTHHLHGHQQH